MGPKAPSAGAQPRSQRRTTVPGSRRPDGPPPGGYGVMGTERKRNCAAPTVLPAAKQVAGCVLIAHEDGRAGRDLDASAAAAAAGAGHAAAGAGFIALDPRSGGGGAPGTRAQAAGGARGRVAVGPLGAAARRRVVRVVPILPGAPYARR